MKKNHLPAVLLFYNIFFIAIALFIAPREKALSAAAHVVISEIQVGGDTTTDEFVELYNPTGTPVDLTGWKLTKKTSGGTESDIIAASMSGTLAPHSYHLIAHTNYDGTVSADMTYAGPETVAANNTVLVYDNVGTLVDKVGMGTATDVETTSTSSPANNRSVERKANSASTADSMTTGADVTAGNGEDTDDNSADFILRPTASGTDPQNSSSATEPTDSTPSPTPGPSVSPSIEPSITPTPSSTPSPTPSVNPSPSLEPSVSPSASPEASVSPTPSASPDTSPTPTPSATPNATPVVSPSTMPSSSPTPSVSPSPSPSNPPGQIIFKGFLFTCRVNYLTFNNGFFSFKIPVFRCTTN